ncbi:hypothetical protein CRYUN_Cryun23aG0026200 [Craigia yunnanensis]
MKGSVIVDPTGTMFQGSGKQVKKIRKKVLFLIYEDMVEDTSFYVKRMAEFMGYNFSLGEERKKNKVRCRK